MSRGSQIVLGLFFAIAAVFSGWLAWYGGRNTPAGATAIYSFSAFSAVVAYACLVRRGRAVTLRIIGAVICAVFTIGGYYSLVEGKILQAVGGFVFFAIPCGYLAITGKYPIWGEVGAVFGEKPKE